jgi:hypothetical protein
MDRNYDNRKAINFYDQQSIFRAQNQLFSGRKPLKMVLLGKFIVRIVL